MANRWREWTGPGSQPVTEIGAGIATWLTMVYIAAVNPQMLAQAGMDFGAVFTATCVAAALGSTLMGLLANRPIALAPGMGLNAVFVYTMVLGMGLSWQAALGVVFWSGILFVVLSATPIRERILNEMPASLKTGAAAGIGLFLALIGLSNAGVIEQGAGTLVSLGDPRALPVGLCFFGFLIIAALSARGHSWAILAGVGAVAVIGWIFDPNGDAPRTIFATVPSLAPTFFALDWKLPLESGVLALVIALLFVDLFDTSGTLLAVGKQGRFLDGTGRFPDLKPAMMADSLATVAGSLFGVSNTTSYIESSAGIAAGGRTGLTSLVVASLFLLTLFIAPLAAAIPPYATAPALIFVAMLLVSALRDHEAWEDVAETAPMLLTAVMMPFSYSIADGLAIGTLAYTGVHILSGRVQRLNLTTWTLSGVFALRFILLSEF